MKFSNYLSERQGINTEPRGGSKFGYDITFVDIDETIFRTFAKILVKDKETGKVKRELDNQEFNSYELQPGEEYDFRQFRDSDLFYKTSIPIPKTVRMIKKMINNIERFSKHKGSRIVFLTARSDFDRKEGVIATFEKHGIKIKSPITYIERTGNLAVSARKMGKSISTEEAKKKVMLKYLKSGDYRRVRLIDDYKPNLGALLDIEKNLPKDIENKVREKWDVPEDEKAIEFFALQVMPDGSLRRIK